jgi:PAS domain-containing protein
MQSNGGRLGAADASGRSVDIAARKDVENQLREAEDRFRGAFDAAAIGMALVCPEGR